MKIPLMCLGWLSVLSAAMAAPDFREHGFKSTLPPSVRWDLRHQFNDPHGSVVMRTYTHEAGGRMIFLHLGKNSTGDKKLAAFAQRFTKQVAAKPGYKITAEKETKLGGLPANAVTAEVQVDGSLRHYFAAVAVQGDKFYICTLVATAKKVEDDDTLTEFLNSIEISQ
jgi:hypothetical protein